MYRILFLLWMLLHSSQNISNEELIRNINHRQKYWVAGENNLTHKATRSCVILPGSIDPDRVKIVPNTKIKIPKYFDARKVFDYCKHVINDVPYQGDCGNCWAVAIAAGFTDRICVARRGNYSRMSAEDLTTCCYECRLGDHVCQGGNLVEALTFMENTGIVTGDNFRITTIKQPKLPGCKPYSLALVLFEAEKYDQKPVFDCHYKCTNEYYFDSYWNDKIKITTWHMLPPGDEKTIQRNIMKYGPVVAVMQLNDEFYLYKQGVFMTFSDPNDLFQHAVNIIGWGTENGLDYWFARNTWGSWNNWGMKGFFKIARREKNLGIETHVFSMYVPTGRGLAGHRIFVASSFCIKFPSLLMLPVGFLLAMVVK